MTEKLDSKIITNKSQKDFLFKGLIKYIYKILYPEYQKVNCKNISCLKILKQYKKNNVLLIIKTKDENIYGAYKNSRWNHDEWIVFDINNRIIFETRKNKIPLHNFILRKDSLYIESKTKKKEYLIFDIEIFVIKLEEI